MPPKLPPPRQPYRSAHDLVAEEAKRHDDRREVSAWPPPSAPGVGSLPANGGYSLEHVAEQAKHVATISGAVKALWALVAGVVVAIATGAIWVNSRPSKAEVAASVKVVEDKIERETQSRQDLAMTIIGLTEAVNNLKKELSEQRADARQIWNAGVERNVWNSHNTVPTSFAATPKK